MTEAQKIITWATADHDGHGAHISSLSMAINSDRVSEEAKVVLKEKMAEWRQ